MADELTSVPVAPVSPNEPGQTQASAPVQPQSAPGGEPGQQAPSKVNLYELPEFKDYQRQVSRTMTEMQQKLAEQERRQHEALMSSMTPEQKTQYQLHLKDQEIGKYKEYVEQQEIASRRMQDIQRLSQWSGADAKVFEAAESYDDAVRIAMEYMRSNSPQAIAAQQAKQAANRVDLGGGGQVVTAADAAEREAKAALERGDSRSYFKWVLEN